MDPLSIALLGFGSIALLAGLAGALIPTLPGPPVSTLGVLLIQIGIAIETSVSTTSWGFCLLTIFFGIIITFIDFISPSIIAKFGGSSKTSGRYAMIAMVVVFISSCVGGSMISTLTAGLGLIPSLFLGFFAVAAAAFGGGMMGELQELPKDDPNRQGRAMKAGLAHVVGIIGGILVKMLFSLSAIGVAITQALIHFN